MGHKTAKRHACGKGTFREQWGGVDRVGGRRRCGKSKENILSTCMKMSKNKIN